MLCGFCEPDVSEEHITSSELGTTLAVTTSLILFTLNIYAIRSSETSVLTRATRRQIPEDGNIRSHRRGNLKSYPA
jgi:hypothetical protein